MTLKDLLLDKLSNMFDGETVAHTDKDGYTYAITKHTACNSERYEYWEGGACLEIYLTANDAVNLFLFGEKNPCFDKV